MQAFSSTVRDLYALAEYASPDQFLTRAIGLMQMWIRFDGAIFGTGEAGDPGMQGMLGAQLATPPASHGRKDIRAGTVPLHRRPSTSRWTLPRTRRMAQRCRD